MQTIFKKTWSCDCGYSQDFEPTEENAKLHFNDDRKFAVNDLKENECPSCALNGQRDCSMSRVTDDAKKARISYFSSQQEIDDWKADRLAKPNRTREVETEAEIDGVTVKGTRKVTETDKEKAARVEAEAANFRPLSAQEIAELKSKHEG